jgi:hypothetical protein
MTTHPPTLVDLAALDAKLKRALDAGGAMATTAEILLLEAAKGFAPALLASLRALAERWEHRAELFTNVSMRNSNYSHTQRTLVNGLSDGFRASAAELRTLLGDAPSPGPGVRP